MNNISRRIGQAFQDSIESSCNENKIFFHNIKDVNYMAIKRGFRIPQNKYDSIIYYRGHLFPMELKTTDKKSISFSESVIKEHQINNLQEAGTYEGVKPGFLLNFREQPENYTFFIPIDRFIEYKKFAENQSEHPYQSRKGKKLNRASISLDICQEIGFELRSELKQVHYRYFIRELLDELISFY